MRRKDRKDIENARREITPRSSKEFEKTGDFLNSIIESSLDGIIAADTRGKITRANASFLQLLGYGESEVVGKHVAEFSMREVGTYQLTTGEAIDITKEYFADQREMLSRLKDGQSVRNRRSYFLRKDGRIVPCEQNISPLLDEMGRLQGAVGIIRDITGRVKSERNLAEMRGFLDDIFKTAADGIIVTDADGIIVMLNNSIEAITGFSRESLIGKHTSELRPEGSEYGKRGRRFAEKLLKEGKALGSDVPWVRKDGSQDFIERNAALLKNEVGEITGAVSTIRDITERKRAEEELKKANEHLDNLIENSLDCIIVSDRKGYITKVNRYFLELFGYRRDEIMGKHVLECTPMLEEGTFECTTGEHLTIGKEFAEDANAMISRLIDQGNVTNWETYYFRKDRKLVPIEQNIVCLFDGSGERMGAVAIIRDITERRKAERELRETKNFLESIIEYSKDGILVVDRGGNILSCNHAIEEMSGFDKERIIGAHASTLITDDAETRKHILEKTAELFEKGFTTYEARYKSCHDEYIDVECISSMIRDESGEYVAGVSIVRNISKRKQAEREIREGKEFLEKIISGSKDGILIGDERGYILSANEAMEEMLGLSREEMQGRHSSEFILDEGAEREKALEKIGDLFRRGFTSYETRLRRKDGSSIEVDCRLSMIKDEEGNYIAGVSIVRDITERKKMQIQLFQAEKLRSLGELAGGVAHDFNNILAAILGRVQLLKMQFKPPEGIEEKRKSMIDLVKSLEIIEKASFDGAETVRRIQEFSRKRVDDKQFALLDVNELLDNALEFTRVRWKSEAESHGINVAIEKDYSPLPATRGSASELREVFTNLINNALDAMPEGGTISIRTTLQGNRIVIAFSDTGSGIPEDMQSRIFDPFFTTKGVQSTGLGMSISYGIINRHKGVIAIESGEGRGTTFTIELPVSDAVAGVKERKVPLSGENRRASVLVIEDEEEVRNLLTDILIEGGHRVEMASSGDRGMKLFDSLDFDLVFTDLGMPGISGWQVAKRIKGIKPGIPVAIITGWNVDVEQPELKERGVDFVVSKPFEVKQILSLVREGLELRDRFDAA